jgi:hypothetical protein
MVFCADLGCGPLVPREHALLNGRALAALAGLGEHVLSRRVSEDDRPRFGVEGDVRDEHVAWRAGSEPVRRPHGRCASEM